MNTTTQNHKVNPKYAFLFDFKNSEEYERHIAKTMSLRILGQIEKYCNQKNIKKKDIAELTGTSRSYITQLFTGTRLLNMEILAKFEAKLEIKLNFQVNSLKEIQAPGQDPAIAERFVLYNYGGTNDEDTAKVVNMLSSKNDSTQSAS